MKQNDPDLLAIVHAIDAQDHAQVQVLCQALTNASEVLSELACHAARRGHWSCLKVLETLQGEVSPDQADRLLIASAQAPTVVGVEAWWKRASAYGQVDAWIKSCASPFGAPRALLTALGEAHWTAGNWDRAVSQTIYTDNRSALAGLLAAVPIHLREATCRAVLRAATRRGKCDLMLEMLNQISPTAKEIVIGIKESLDHRSFLMEAIWQKYFDLPGVEFGKGLHSAVMHGRGSLVKALLTSKNLQPSDVYYAVEGLLNQSMDTEQEQLFPLLLAAASPNDYAATTKRMLVDTYGVREGGQVARLNDWWRQCNETTLIANLKWTENDPIKYISLTNHMLTFAPPYAYQQALTKVLNEIQVVKPKKDEIQVIRDHLEQWTQHLVGCHTLPNESLWPQLLTGFDHVSDATRRLWVVHWSADQPDIWGNHDSWSALHRELQLEHVPTASARMRPRA